MASSPGLNGHPTEEQLSHLRNNNNNINNNTNSLNHSNHLANGSSRGVRFQQHDQDAIVPASDQDDNDDSTEEDEAYNSYIQEQEQQQHNQHQIKQNLGLTRQHYGSAGSGEHDMADGDDEEDGYGSHRQQQQQQQQPHHHQHQQLRQIQQQYQLQQQQHLHAYKTQAMNIQQLLHQDQTQDHDMAGTDSHEEDEYYQHNPHHDPHLQHQMDIDMQDHHDDLSEDMEDDDDDFDDDVEEDGVDDEMMDDDDDDDDEGSEAISLTEDDIDFNLVYAFHTFVATQEGQASVVRNDSLMLLEDVNVYWWLVRVLKTGVIGYIPAENIETPFERLARLNTYRNVALSAPSPEWGTFDEHIQPLDPAVLEQRAANRRSVVFTAQNEFLEPSETEWSDEEDEEGGWYDDGEEEGEDDDEDEEDEADEEHGEEHEESTMVEDDVRTAVTKDETIDTNREQGHDGAIVKSDIQLEAERVQQEILNDQRKHDEMLAMKVMERDQDYNRQSQQAADKDSDESEDEEVQATNRYRKPLLDEDDLLFSGEKRTISLTPPIARDDNLIHRESPSKARNLRLTDDTAPRQSPQPSQQLQHPSSQQQRQPSPVSSSTLVRSPSFDSEEEEKEKKKRQMAERKEAKISSILGNGPQEPIVRKSKEEYERGLPPEAVIVKKPGKFKSLFSVGKSSKDKERKEKERLEKERLKNLAKSSAVAAAVTSNSSSGISNNLFRTRSNSNGSIGSSNTAPSSTATPPSPTFAKKEEHQQDIMTLRVYPGNVDFGASMYKTVVITPATMASDVAHQAVVKFRLAPDGTASTGDFFLTVKGVDGDETVLQATDKPMAIYQSLTAHLTTPLPLNHRLSISSVSSMMSANSSGSLSSNSNQAVPGTPTLRRTGSGRAEPQQRSIRFLLNKKIKRASSISVASASMPSTPTTPTAPQEDFFWVKVVCQAQDLPQSMVLLEGMGSAMEKADSRTHGQSYATKVEHWIPMHSTSNAGDVIFKTLEKVGIRAGVVDGVPEHVLVAKRLAVPHGLVIEYQLGLKVADGVTKKLKQSEEISLPPQVPLAKCFEDHKLVPVRRSPKADVASMPLHPDYVFFVRKASKSLQAEMKFVQDRLQQQQARGRVPPPLQTQQSDRNSIDTDAQASPAANGMVSPTASGFPGRNSNGQHAQANSAAAATRLAGATSPPVRIPRRTDSVIMSPTSTPIRANSFDNSSGRPSPTPSAQNMMTTQQIHPPQMSRTPTPDRHQHQVRTRSPSISQGSPTALARPLQAPSPAPSNLSSHGDQQEGSRSSTPERLSKLDRPERQRALSPSLTHGPSPLSMSAIMLSNDTSSSPVTRKELSEEPSISSFSSSSSPANRLNVKKNATQGVDIVLQKGIVRSSRSQGHYQYQFVPFGGGEEIDITEIIEDVLGGDSDNEDEDDDDDNHNHHTDQHSIQGQDLASMSRRERVQAAVARASQAVAAGKERRKAIAKVRPSSGSGVSLRSSPSRDWDRLEQLSSSARGGETLLKLERALAAEAVAGSGSPSSRNLPSPMSLTSSSPSSPTLNRRTSDAEVHIASVTTMGQNTGLPGSVRNYSPIPAVIKENDNGSRTHSPGRSSPSTPTGYTRPTLLANLSSSPSNRGTNSNPSSPSSVMAPLLHPIEGRSYSPLPRPLQTPSPAALPHQLSIRTSLASSSSADPTSPSTEGSSATSPLGPLPHPPHHNNVSRSRSASASVAEGGFRKGGHGASASESAVTGSSLHHHHDPWLLASDYNTGMQDLLTLVRGGRSSSVSTSAPSSLRGGFTLGKDGKIVQGPLSPTHHARHRMFSSQASSPTSSSASLMYNSNNTHTNTHHQHHKDTQAHDRHLDDTNTSGRSANHNDHVYMTTNTFNAIDEAAEDWDGDDGEQDGQDEEPRIWVRTDRRLRDVRNECHPEVFECWREVDADLDKVERQLDSLLATVKAAIF